MTCLMILTGSGSLAKDWVRGPGSGYPDGWTTTSEVARQCQLLQDGNYDPPSACKEPMSIEDMSDKKKSAGMCMLPFSGGPTVEYENGTTNVAEWAIIKVSGCVCDSMVFLGKLVLVITSSLLLCLWGRAGPTGQPRSNAALVR